MLAPSPKEVSRLLIDWGNGDQAALDELIPLVYEELRRLAGRYMRRESQGHTLQTSALVNEAYLRLIDQKSVRWQNRAHFFGVAAQLMRRILVDHARSRSRAKRGGGAQMVSLAEQAGVSEEIAEVLALDSALNGLTEIDPRKSQIVEMKFFGGLTTEEMAEVLKVTPRTVEREWRNAKAWLHRAISQGATRQLAASPYNLRASERTAPSRQSRNRGLSASLSFPPAFEVLSCLVHALLTLRFLSCGTKPRRVPKIGQHLRARRQSFSHKLL